MKTNELKSKRAIKLSGGFTLVELIVYVSIFSIVSVFLTGVLITSLDIQGKNVSRNEVNNQLSLVVNTTQRLVRDSSLIEDVSCASSYCSVKLRMANEDIDPTIIWGDETRKKVYIEQGGVETAITNDNVTVDSLTFLKKEIPGGHSILQVDATISLIGETASTSSARSVVARVNAATFDSDLIPGGTWSLGLIGTKWANGFFSGNLSVDGDITADGNITINPPDPDTPQTVYRCDTGNLTTDETCAGAVDTGLRVK